VEAQANGKEVWINKRPTSGRQCSDWQRTLSDDEALKDFYSIISDEDRIVPNTVRKLDTLLTHMIAIWLQLPRSRSHKNYIFDSESPLLSLLYFSFYHKTNIYTERMRRLLSVGVTYILDPTLTLSAFSCGRTLINHTHVLLHR